MKVRKMVFFIIFGLIGAFVCYQFKFYNDIESLLFKNETKIGKIYVSKPSVTIIDEESNTRPIGISINNNHATYPHSGLQEAYLAYELIAEGGITRILAFYKDVNVSKIGSTRSARHYFLDYILENDAIFVHFGYSPQAKADISSLDIDNINGLVDGSAFYRESRPGKAYEHTAYTKMSKINKTIKSKKYRTTSDSYKLLNYSAVNIDYTSDSTVKDANSVSIKYSAYQTTKYVYDKENNNYLMYMNGSKHVDEVTNKQYTVKNIITYQVSNSEIDSHNRQDLDNIGSGEGYFISNGKAIKIKWSKKSRSEKTKYTLMNGEELVVNDGNTWIHIQPKGQNLTIE